VDREIACDDNVLSALADRKAYALSLTEFACRKQSCDVIAAPAAWSNESQLKQRIDMILDSKRNTSPRLARGKTSFLAVAALIVATLAFQMIPRLAFAQGAVEAPPAEPAAVAIPAQPAAAATPSEPAEPDAPALAGSGPRVKPFIGHPVPPSVAIGVTAPPFRSQPHVASVVAPDNRALYVAAGDTPEEGGPRAKPRARAGGDESIERRLDRLERMIEKLAQRDAERKDLQFQFQDKFNPDFRFNQQDFAKLNEKISKDAAKAAEKAARDAEKIAKEHKGWMFENKGEMDGLKATRQALEAQREALEKQVQALQRQIQRLERDQKRLEEDRGREENRRNKEEKRRAEEKDRGDDGEKEKK
jgi:hypothetical protein